MTCTCHPVITPNASHHTTVLSNNVRVRDAESTQTTGLGVRKSELRAVPFLYDFRQVISPL